MWALKSLYEKLTSEYKGVVNIAIGNCWNLSLNVSIFACFQDIYRLNCDRMSFIVTVQRTITKPVRLS